MRKDHPNQMLLDWTARVAAAPAPKPKPRRRGPVLLPKPTPLESAIRAKHFGEEDDEPVTPGPDEVRAITEHHAERIIDLLQGSPRTPSDKDRVNGQIGSALAMYAEDFGQEAADHLESYCRCHADKNRGRGR